LVEEIGRERRMGLLLCGTRGEAEPPRKRRVVEARGRRCNGDSRGGPAATPSRRTAATVPEKRATPGDGEKPRWERSREPSRTVDLRIRYALPAE